MGSDRFAMIMNAVYGLVLRKQGPTLAVRAAHFALLYTMDLSFHREMIPSNNNLSLVQAQRMLDAKMTRVG
jgi:hypothetical protein